MILLLDHLVHTAFNRQAIFLPEALSLLELDSDAYRTLGPEVMTGIADVLVTAAADGPQRALEALKPAMVLLGAPRRPRASGGDEATKQLALMTQLAAQLRSPEPLVTGMTIHQAKGREWDRVGVRPASSEQGRPSAGLSRDAEATERYMSP